MERRVKGEERASNGKVSGGIYKSIFERGETSFGKHSISGLMGLAIFNSL